MYCTITVTITRPNINSNFWYDTNYYQTIRPEVQTIFNEAIGNSQLIIDFNSDKSNDQLTYTRVTVFRDIASKDIFMDEYNNKFPNYEVNRQSYCLNNGHILTITEG